MKPQSAKAKGRRLQQKVANSILEAFPSLQPTDCFSTSMGAPGEDVHLSPAARACVPLSFECKNTERLNLWAAVEQCAHNSPSGTNPCVVFSRNNAPTYACVEWKLLLSLLKRCYDAPAPVSAASASTEGAVVDDKLQRLIDELSEYASDQKQRP